jgi:hypothetical protein
VTVGEEEGSEDGASVSSGVAVGEEEDSEEGPGLPPSIPSTSKDMISGSTSVKFRIVSPVGWTIPKA